MSEIFTSFGAGNRTVQVERICTTFQEILLSKNHPFPFQILDRHRECSLKRRRIENLSDIYLSSL